MSVSQRATVRASEMATASKWYEWAYLSQINDVVSGKHRVSNVVPSLRQEIAAEVSVKCIFCHAADATGRLYLKLSLKSSRPHTSQSHHKRATPMMGDAVVTLGDLGEAEGLLLGGRAFGALKP